MKKNIVVAISDNYAIGKDNTIPWYIAEDLKHFKALTTGCPIIMGRKTFESIGKMLPQRLNIVVSKSLKEEGLIGTTKGESEYRSLRGVEESLENTTQIKEVMEKLIVVNSLDAAFEQAEIFCSLKARQLELGEAEIRVNDCGENTQLCGKRRTKGEELKKEYNCFVIGGEQIYRAALNKCDSLFISKVYTTVDNADSFFPKFELSEWKETALSELMTDKKNNNLQFQFIRYDKCK